MGRPADTNNYIYRMGTAPNTRAAISQKNKVFSYAVGTKEFRQIGAVSEFGQDESRTIDPVRGVGFGDQIAELVPGSTEPMTLTLNKTLLYAVNVFQTVGYKGGVTGLVRSLRHHRWPFDIKQEWVFSEIVSSEDIEGVTAQALPNASTQATGQEFLTPIRALYTFFEGCWFNSYSNSSAADSALVVENSSVTVTDIIDGRSQYGEYIDSGLAPVSSNGAPGKGFSLRFAGGSQTPTAQ
jgi:hypothetical protein